MLFPSMHTSSDQSFFGMDSTVMPCAVKLECTPTHSHDLYADKQIHLLTLWMLPMALCYARAIASTGFT